MVLINLVKLTLYLKSFHLLLLPIFVLLINMTCFSLMVKRNIDNLILETTSIYGRRFCMIVLSSLS
jgi:hypothetical protein